MTYNFIPPKKQGPVLNDLPIFDCTFTQATREWMNFQKGYCQAYELDFARCAARVGAVNAVTQCRKYMDDMQECAFHRKSVCIMTEKVLLTTGHLTIAARPNVLAVCL